MGLYFQRISDSLNDRKSTEASMIRVSMIAAWNYK